MTALLAVSAVLIPSPAQAAGTGTVTLGTRLEYKAADGKANGLVVSRSGDTLTFDDAVALKAGSGCRAVPGHRTVVTCTVADPGTFVVTLGDKNDSFSNRTALPARVYGGSGNDKLTGGPGADRLDGGTGDDKLYGNGGDDDLLGRTGNDLLDAGPGNDDLWGDEGNDTLVGREGNDYLDGAAGKDVVWAGAGDDTIGDSIKSTDVFHGGTGTDSVDYSDRKKAVVADLDGRSSDDGESGETDTIGADVERLYGGDGNDQLTGNSSANYLDGWKGDDKLYGLDGDDVIDGSTGKDTIEGGAGADRITGGDGPDILRGGAGPDVLVGGNGQDTITGDADDDELYGWKLPPSGPEEELWHPQPGDDVLSGALDGGAGNDLCNAGPSGSRINCERDVPDLGRPWPPA